MAIDEAAFTKLIRQHAGIIHKIVYLYADDAEDRKDLYQEVLYQAWKSADRFEGRSQFSTWLYRVSLNTALVFRRKEGKTGKNHSLDERFHDLAAPATFHDERSEWLLKAIRQLSDIDKTLITLYLEDYGNDEIAEITGLTKNHVAVKIHRIKNTLTQQLKAIQHG